MRLTDAQEPAEIHAEVIGDLVRKTEELMAEFDAAVPMLRNAILQNGIDHGCSLADLTEGASDTTGMAEVVREHLEHFRRGVERALSIPTQGTD